MKTNENRTLVAELKKHWFDSTYFSRDNRFRKPLLYPPELQAHVCRDWHIYRPDV